MNSEVAKTNNKNIKEVSFLSPSQQDSKVFGESIEALDALRKLASIGASFGFGKAQKTTADTEASTSKEVTTIITEEVKKEEAQKIANSMPGTQKKTEPATAQTDINNNIDKGPNPWQTASANLITPPGDEKGNI